VLIPLITHEHKEDRVIGVSPVGVSLQGAHRERPGRHGIAIVMDQASRAALHRQGKPGTLRHDRR
jgi:hypothetical protein